jgi:hypothetical protein
MKVDDDKLHSVGRGPEHDEVKNSTAVTGPAGLAQPWHKLLKAEENAGVNPWLNWKPNPNDFGEKPWLKIKWSEDDLGSSVDRAGIVRSKSPDVMSGYSVGGLPLE